MKYIAMLLLVAVTLVGCEGDMGPMGPTGPQGPSGEDGRDGTGITGFYGWYNEDPLASNTVTVPIPGWPGLQDGESMIFQAYAGAQINNVEGLSELPMLVNNGGQLMQAAALLNTVDGTVTFTYLKGWYVVFTLVVFQKP